MSFDTRPLRKIAEDWLISNERPRVAEDVLEAWDRLIEDWTKAAHLPLLLRVGGTRGQPFAHVTGRELVRTDNSPANWALSYALEGRVPSLGEVRESLDSGRLPVAFAQKRHERANSRYCGTLRAKMNPPNLNTAGWAICHVLDIGIGRTGGPIEALPDERLLRHFRLFLHPRNMFVVPERHGCLGETPEFQEVFGNHPWFRQSVRRQAAAS